MALHVRRQITDAVRAALLDLSPNDAVYKGRTWPLDEKTSRAILIWTRGGESQFDAMDDSDATRPLERDERLVVEAIVRHAGAETAQGASVEDLLDDMAAEIEPRLMADAAFGALVESRELVRTEKDSAVQGDHRRGMIRLTYRILYRTPAASPTTKV